MAEPGGARILVVEDNVEVADTYASQLEGEYDVGTVYSGPAALEALSPSVDVVLLDRRLPKLSGSEVLEVIRERGLETRVAMVTGEEADFDIIEMPFDDYVRKPVTRGALQGTVARLVRCLRRTATGVLRADGKTGRARREQVPGGAGRKRAVQRTRSRHRGGGSGAVGAGRRLRPDRLRPGVPQYRATGPADCRLRPAVVVTGGRAGDRWLPARQHRSIRLSVGSESTNRVSS